MTSTFYENDLEEMRGSATEENWDAFVGRIGGYKVSDRYPDAKFENADYVFPDQRVIVELKIIENEIDKSDQFREKARALFRQLEKKHEKTPLSLDPVVSEKYLKGFVELFRAPLARIAKKANRQIRSTKENLGLEGYHGVWLLINNNLRELPPRMMLGTIFRILRGSCSSIDANIYLTNHYILFPEDEFARILWVPMYGSSEPGELKEFVDWLGRQWFNYTEELGDPADDRVETDDFSLEGSFAAGSRFPLT